jgi:Rho family, other
MSSSSHSPSTPLILWTTSQSKYVYPTPERQQPANITLPQWIEEVRNICGPTIPILLVGCKADLRPTPDAPDFVSRAQAERVAADIGARAYKECSALKIEGVDDVFEAATRASMLMREGVPTGGGAGAGMGMGMGMGMGEKHHRRRSSGRSSGGVEDDASGCRCVIC